MTSLHDGAAAPAVRLAGVAGNLAAAIGFSDRETRITVVALIPAMAVALWTTGGAFALVAAWSLGLVLFWAVLFARLRRRVLGLHEVSAAMVFVLLLAPDAPLWQAGLSISFGVTLGSLLFGGRGFSFLHPAVVALAFQYFSFPPVAPPEGGVALMLAILAGALLLLATGVLPWRTLAGLALGLSALLAGSGDMDAGLALMQPSALLILFFLVCDAGSGGMTRAGRFLHGLLAAIVIAVLGAGEPANPRLLIFAALLSSILAPLIDRLVIMVHAHRRRRRLERA